MKNLEKSNFIIYTSDDGSAKLQVNIEDETVWLNQEQMAILFGKSKKTISEHIVNIYDEEEQIKEVSLKKSGNTGFQQKSTNYYNLDMIISVGYRVRSLEGTQFRKWATERLKEYIVKGFTMDDERLKQGGGRARYFEELLQRIRDIRSSERNFYQKVTDIYATSIDYKNDEKTTQNFFATVQNKMHYAVHGKTAAELIKGRVDSRKELLGLTNFKGKYITPKDITIAKNYLTEEEIKSLNRIVTMYLDYAEDQAEKGIPLTMEDWAKKLNLFLEFNDKDILNNSGKVTSEIAKKFAENEFEKYQVIQDKIYVSDFDKEVKKMLL